MIDLHAHILPGVDDGPVDVDATVQLARAAAANGTARLATTSHVDHSFELPVEQFADWRSAAQQALDADGIDLELIQGGELALTRYPELSDEQLHLITLGGSRTILLEPPFSPAGRLLENAVFELQSRGFDVLLAHPERSPDFAQRLDELSELVHRGVHFQVTSSSLSGAFGKHAQDLAVELFHRGLVHVIASDGHGAQSRTPDVNRHIDAAAKLLPEVAADREYWIEVAPAAILEQGEVPEPPPVRRPGRLGRRRRRG